MEPNLLIHQLRKGDLKAFRTVYDSYYNKLAHYLFLKIHNRQDTLDLVQECFYKLWRYRESVSDKYSIEQQLFFIARRVLIDYYRKNQRVEIIHNKDLSNISAEDKTKNTISFDIKDRLTPVLNQMPALRKEIFILNKFEGYSYKEIASYYALSEKAVENHIYKALKFIRNHIILLLIIFSLEEGFLFLVRITK